jgi:hypothetical protein
VKLTRCCRDRRPQDLGDGDIVVGEFLDSSHDLLVRSASDGVLIGLSLDPRADWDRVGDDLGEFLERYADGWGNKFWQPSRFEIADWQKDSLPEIVSRLAGSSVVDVELGVRFGCEFEPPASDAQLAAARTWLAADNDELCDLWRLTRQAHLFVETSNGGWGLRLASPERSAELTTYAGEQRPQDHRDGDAVVGEFLDGSHELLIRSSSHGFVISRPNDTREHSAWVADSLTDFLQRYGGHWGQKSWEYGTGLSGTWQSPARRRSRSHDRSTRPPSPAT